MWISLWFILYNPPLLCYWYLTHILHKLNEKIKRPISYAILSCKLLFFKSCHPMANGWQEQETPSIAEMFAIIIILMCETKCHSPEELGIWQIEALISCRSPCWVSPWVVKWIPTLSLLQMSEIWENPANLYSHQPIKIKIWAQAQQKQCQRGLSTVILPTFALSWAVTWLAKLLVTSISREVNSNH